MSMESLFDSTEHSETAVRARACSWIEEKRSRLFCPTSIRRNGEVAFFSHAARLAYDLEGQGGKAGQRKAKGA